MSNDIVYTYMYIVYAIYNAWIIRFEKPITRSMPSSAKLSKLTILGSSFAFNFPDFCQVETKTCIGDKSYETILLTRIIINGFLASSFNCNIDLFSARVQQPVTGLRGHRSSKLYSRSTSHWPFQWPRSKTYMIGFFLSSIIQRVFNFRKRVFFSTTNPPPAHPQSR